MSIILFVFFSVRLFIRAAISRVTIHVHVPILCEHNCSMEDAFQILSCVQSGSGPFRHLCVFLHPEITMCDC